MFLAASIAENKRIPFDAPEAESELVAGYFTEYSGLKFGMFFMSEFIEMVTISAIVTILFFGCIIYRGKPDHGPQSYAGWV